MVWEHRGPGYNSGIMLYPPIERNGNAELQEVVQAQELHLRLCHALRYWRSLARLDLRPRNEEQVMTYHEQVILGWFLIVMVLSGCIAVFLWAVFAHNADRVLRRFLMWRLYRKNFKADSKILANATRFRHDFK